jgi:hypothetical protein
VPRDRVVTPDSVAEAVAAVDRPFASTGDLSDRLGVTKQAIRNRHDELAESSRLEHGKVGRQRVYWLSERETAPSAVENTAPPAPPQEASKPADSGDNKGLLERLFTSLPHFGSPAELWFLTALAAVLGLLLGVVFSIAVFNPTPPAATVAALAVLALTVSVAVPVALYYLIGQLRPTTEGEKA